MCTLLMLLVLPHTATTTLGGDTEVLFNGNDLSGWAGKPGFWTVKDGAIFGQTTKDNLTEGNTFLVWQGGEVADFIFKAKVRFSGNTSGVQFRSELVGPAEDFAVKGYQADLHRPRPRCLPACSTA